MSLRDWRPRTPPLPDHLRPVVKPDDPEWFARELAIAAAPPWWFWRFLLRRFSWLVSVAGRVEVTGTVPEELRRGPLLLAVHCAQFVDNQGLSSLQPGDTMVQAPHHGGNNIHVVAQQSDTRTQP